MTYKRNGFCEQTVPLFPYSIIEGAGKRLIVIKPRRNLVSNRLRLFKDLMTDAVFICDDDTIISESELVRAHTLWRSLPDHLVGFACKSHVHHPNETEEYTYLAKDYDGKYSIILPAPMLLHRDWFTLFNRLPASVYDMMDKYNNCDDIVMNVAVSNATQHPGVCLIARHQEYAKIDSRARQFKGQKSKNTHILYRTRCLNELSAIYGYMPLRYNNNYVTTLLRTKS
ncbi:PREDICTED: exostosin-like 2 [Priapulus caudatus]|uniref:Exostosin-like 2 n=1 Tax=Priapulus caudatus TaxID=37621 RepID=A0ABM1E5J6_PRICU|nr:PREDICTED: exostosin-like 2 [Priapulus caudatus]